MEAGEGENPCLDLTVTVYNINKGRNEELLRRSKRLADYAEFVARVRENGTAMPLDHAVTEAVRYCVKNRILAEFLEEHGSEVMNMLLEEWNWDEAKEVWWEEGWEEGMEEGRNQILDLIKRGYTTEQIKAKLTEDSQDQKR